MAHQNFAIRPLKVLQKSPEDENDETVIGDYIDDEKCKEGEVCKVTWIKGETSWGRAEPSSVKHRLA